MVTKARSCVIYDRYLSTLGGGERVAFAIAKALEDGYDVTIYGPRIPTPERVELLGFPTSIRLRRAAWWKFPLLSWRRDVSVFFALRMPVPGLARHNIVVAQFPFTSLSRRAALRWLQQRLLRRSTVVAYSTFARDWIQRRWQHDAVVVPPPVHLGGTEKRKENIVVAVGRFFPTQHTKRQDILVEAVRRLPAEVRRSWEFVFAGGLDDAYESVSYLASLQRAAEGLPIRFVPNIAADDLRDLLGQATLFWHATGYGRDPSHPETAEHFGITTVEAMSHGVVPLVYADGGQLEVLAQGGGLSWRTVDELVSQTVMLATEGEQRRALSREARVASSRYSEAEFVRRFRSLVERSATGEESSRSSQRVPEQKGKDGVTGNER